MKQDLIKYKCDNPSSQTIPQVITDKLKTFMPELDDSYTSNKIRASLILADLTEIPKCYCGNQLHFMSPGKAKTLVTAYGGWSEYCSLSCMHRSAKVIAKRKSTTKQNWGVESFSQIQEFKPWDQKTKDEFNRKSKETNLAKRGVEHHSKTQEYLDKRETTTLLKMGVKNAFQSEQAIAARIASMGTDSWFNTEAADISRRTRIQSDDERHRRWITSVSAKAMDIEFLDILLTKDSARFQEYVHSIVESNGYYCRAEVANHIGFSPSHTNKMFKKFGMQEDYLITKGRSFAESQITEFLKSLNVEYIISDRTICEGKELDVYIPSHKLAIEYDGIFYHTEQQGKDKDYHLNKTELCEAKGIQLLRIFENEWQDLNRREIWKSMIKHRLGFTETTIGARECKFVEVTATDAREFLNHNHLAGFRSTQNHYGLMYKNELISVMSIGLSIHRETEIVRFASKLNTNIIGALSKFLKNINVENLITYADRRFTSTLHNSYGQVFNDVKIISPGWYGVESGELKHRLSYTKEKMSSYPIYDGNKTAYENMLANKIDRIWDCGNLKFSNLNK